MPSWCGKEADKLRTDARTTMDVLSTGYARSPRYMFGVRAKGLLAHSLFTPKYTVISPAKKGSLPLSEHYLYPVSTAPINYYNQLKF